jgi:ribokinase
LLQCEIPDRVNALVTKAAARAGVPVMWDTGGDDRAVPGELLPLIEYLCPNETELARIAGVPSVESVEQAIEVARVMQKRGARNLLVTLGADGSVFVPESSSSAPAVYHQPRFSVERVVDTTGAGDCYRAAFAVGVAQGRSIPDSMAFAAAASALCVQVAGAQPSMPTVDRVAELLASSSAQ